MDKFFLLLINREWTNPLLDRLMATMTNFEVWFPVLIAAGLLLLWVGKFRGRVFLLATLVTIGVTDGGFTQFAKRWINRPRPAQALAGVREVSLEKTKPALLGVTRAIQVSYSPPPNALVEQGRSFPSGHAMNNTVIAVYALLCFGRIGLLYLIPALLVSYSRIYCGSHWPSDILVSIILAIGFSLIMAAILNLVYAKIGPRWLSRLYTNHPSLFAGSTA